MRTDNVTLSNNLAKSAFLKPKKCMINVFVTSVHVSKKDSWLSPRPR